MHVLLFSVKLDRITSTSLVPNAAAGAGPTAVGGSDTGSQVASLRTDTQITFSLHFTPLGIRSPRCVNQPLAFLVLETIILGHFSTHC